MLAHADAEGHALWHLVLLLLAPGIIIFGLTRLDRARDSRSGLGSSTAAGGRGRPRPGPGGCQRRDIRFLAAACAGAGLIHLAVAPEHYTEDRSVGVFFALLGLLQVAWSVGVMRHRRWGLLVLGAVTNAGAVSLWAYTRTAGAEAIGPLDVLAVALETTVVILTLLFIVRGTATLSVRTPRLISRTAKASRLRRRLPVETALTAHEPHATPRA